MCRHFISWCIVHVYLSILLLLQKWKKDCYTKQARRALGHHVTSVLFHIPSSITRLRVFAFSQHRVEVEWIYLIQNNNLLLFTHRHGEKTSLSPRGALYVQLALRQRLLHFAMHCVSVHCFPNWILTLYLIAFLPDDSLNPNFSASWINYLFINCYALRMK